MAIRELLRDPQPAPGTAGGRIRRCNFRRLTLVRGGDQPLYEVECLRAQGSVPLPLGDLETARPICDTCQAGNIFRPDED